MNLNEKNFDFLTPLQFPLHGGEEVGGHAVWQSPALSHFPMRQDSHNMDASPDFQSFPDIAPISLDPHPLFEAINEHPVYNFDLSDPGSLRLSVEVDSQVAPLPIESASSPEVTPKASKAKTEKKSAKKVISRQERQEQRKIKHRLIDRKRRMREKHSIEELKDLVAIQPSEKPDKATVVAGAVRTIKSLQQQVAELEAQLARQSLSVPAPPSPNAALALMDDRKDALGSYKDFVALSAVLSGLGSSEVVAIVIGLKDCTIKDVNSFFETVSGFTKSEVVGRKFSDAPLYGRHVHGAFPREPWKRPTDPQQALIPTASAEDYTLSDFQQAVDVVLRGGSWKVVSRHMTRDGAIIIESLNTLFLLRNVDNQPYAVMCLSTPDQRRMIPNPHSHSLSHSHSHSHPHSRPSGAAVSHGVGVGVGIGVGVVRQAIAVAAPASVAHAAVPSGCQMDSSALNSLNSFNSLRAPLAQPS